MGEEPDADALEGLVTAGLYDPDAPDAGERLELLRYLLDHDIDLQALVAADRVGRLVQAHTDVMVEVPATLSCRDMAARTGLPVAVVARVWRSSGFPVPALDAPLFDERDISVFRAFSAGASQFGVEATMQWVRVLGSGLTRVADASVSLFLSKVASRLDALRAPAVVAAKASADATRLLLAVPEFAVAPLFRHHALAAIHRADTTVGSASTGGFDLKRLAVGIVDLVDFTPLSAELSPQELAVALDELETAASDAVTATDTGVIVKYLGDALMYVAADVGEGVAIALELAARVARHPVLTALRSGIAYGDLLSVGGDYFGPPVNLAARAADLAPAGSVLVTAEVVAAAGEAVAGAVSLGPMAVKGFGEPIELFQLVPA